MLITILKYIFTIVFMIFLIIFAVGSTWLNYERKLEERENERKIQQTDKKRGE